MRSRLRGARGRDATGFTLLEVMVAMAILGFAVVAAIQLAAQGLRLLKLSGEHQRAVFMADQLLRETEPSAEAAVSTGEDGSFTWERRIKLIAVPEDLDAPRARQPRLYAVTVAVRWGDGRSTEAATLRTSVGEAETRSR